jgi:hypothetical protein
VRGKEGGLQDHERDRPLLLVIDQRQSMLFGSRRAMKSVVTAEAAALADIYAQLDALRTHEVQPSAIGRGANCFTGRWGWDCF